jgi:DNA repair protein RadC
LVIKWKHPGGKLIEEGAGKLTDEELVAILISSVLRVNVRRKSQMN